MPRPGRNIKLGVAGYLIAPSAPMSETATLDAPHAAAPKDRTAELKLAILTEKVAWERWKGDRTFGPDELPRYLTDAIVGLTECFGDGQIPYELARVSVMVDDVRYAYVRWCHHGDTSLRGLFLAHENYAKERDRKPLDPLPSIQDLEEQKVSHQQIVKIWKLSGISQVLQELRSPGSIVTPEKRLEVETLRLGPLPKSTRADRIAPRPKAPDPVRRASLEELVLERVPRQQIVEMKLREMPSADRAAVESAVDAMAKALGVELPANAQAAMSVAGESWNRAAHGVGGDDELPMPLVGGMPKPLDTLNALLARPDSSEEAPSASTDLATRCQQLFESGMSYEDVAEEVGISGRDPKKRVREVKRLIAQAVNGAAASVDEIPENEY